MQTPWGEIEVRDAHSHFFSRSFFQALAAQRGASDVDRLVESLGWHPPAASDRDLAGDWVHELDHHGVARTVLMASLPGHEESVGTALRAFPDRFYGYFMLDPLASGSVQRARRAFDELGLRGLCLFPAMLRFSVQDERLAPLYELAAAAPGRAVFVHCGLLTVGVRARLGLPSRFDMSFSNPIDLHRVALEHPGTRFIIPHFGAGFLREALMVASLAPNVYLDTSSSNGWTRYLTPQPTLAEVFAQALEVVGPRRLLFGTDSSFFPRGWRSDVLRQQTSALHGLGLQAEDARLILGGNLKRLLED